MEIYDQDGKLHSYSGNPAVIRFYDIVYHEEWYNHGKLTNKKDGPAAITRVRSVFNDDGTDTYEDVGMHVSKCWADEGKLYRVNSVFKGDTDWHSRSDSIKTYRINGRGTKELHSFDDKPAICNITDIDSSNYGKIRFLEWYYHGRLHRKGLPAVIEVDKYSIHIEYRIKGALHRTDGGPALVYLSDAYRSGRVCSYEWRRNGKLHRKGDMPAYVKISYDGKAVCKYYSNGELKKTVNLERKDVGKFIGKYKNVKENLK